jgi:hypothetical protein
MTKADLHERLDSLGYGPHSDLTHLHYASLPTLPPLNTPAGGQAVLALALAVEATLVIVDTTGRAVDGDENDSGPYRDFARHTGLPLKQHDIGLLRTDHAGKDKTKGQRGSSAKNDDVDVVFRLDLADNGYTLQRTHSRVGWVPERVAIERIQDPDGQIRFNTNRAQLWPVGTVETAAQLDLLRCPADATTREASAILRDSGIGRRAAVVGAALRYRRESGLAGDPVEF